MTNPLLWVVESLPGWLTTKHGKGYWNARGWEDGSYWIGLPVLDLRRSWHVHFYGVNLRVPEGVMVLDPAKADGLDLWVDHPITVIEVVPVD